MKLTIFLLASLAAFGEPLLVFPVGSYEDAPFSDQDLLNVGLEFPQDPGAYFSNVAQTVICIPSLLNPAITWCSTKAETWTPPAYVPVNYIPPQSIKPPAPQVVATPEPEPVAIVGFVLLFLIVMILKRRPI